MSTFKIAMILLFSTLGFYLAVDEVDKDWLKCEINTAEEASKKLEVLQSEVDN